MTPFDLFSEPFAPTGNIAAEGFRNLLGRPALGLLQTVIREAIQNSIDAVNSDLGPEVFLRTRRLARGELETLRERVFASTSLFGDENAPLAEALTQQELRVFEIADYHTTGLAGPTRADAPADNDEDPDFANFMRNVGAARDTPQGGGTYGYGKTSLYALSGCTTILVDSQTTFEHQPIRRAMACRLGAAFDSGPSGGRKRYTGRHWWGRADGTDGIEPVEGEKAEQLAAALGLPERDATRTGTTIMVVAPLLDEDLDLGLDLVETVLWNFWPRMCSSTETRRRLIMRIEVDGAEVHVPRPEGFPPLDLFVRALEGARSGTDVKSVESQRPAKKLGTLAFRKGLRADRHPATLRSESAVPTQSCHIALMRPVELVVKYIEGEPFPDRRFEWAGVFICSSEGEVEQAFADSEPPAHDDWIPDMLPKGPTKTYVNVALRRLTEQARTFANPLSTTVDGDGIGPSLASTAALMGRMLENASATGPGKRRGSSGGGRRKSLSVSTPRFVRLEVANDARLAVFEADLVNDRGLPGVRVRAEPHLIMDGAAASADDIPVGFSGQVASLSLNGREAKGDVLADAIESGRIECRVPMPEDAAVGLKLHLEGQALK